jgi:hypothetical protein
MTYGGEKQTAPQVSESLEKLGLPPLVSNLITYSEFIPNLKINTSKEQGLWMIEHWRTTDMSVPTILISHEDNRMAYEVSISDEEDGLQRREVTHIQMGRGRTEVAEITVDTSQLLHPKDILASKQSLAQNPSDQQP